jgi:hypothetical protein
MSYSMRNYRHRNPQGGEEKKGSQPFFQGEKGKAVQRKKKEAFFVQRLATSHEDEKLGTNDARMEKDKEDPLKPVQKADQDKKPGGKDTGQKPGGEKKKKKKPAGGAAGGKVQKKEKPGATAAVAAELEHQAGKGSQLPADLLAEMGHKFGADFSHVRIHHDAAAAALCTKLHAQAFTHGCDIYFNEGQYHPDSPEGKHLLAHELTHVIQQHS